MEFNWDEFKDRNNKIAVNCKTQEEANDFCKQMNEHGLKWCDGKSYLYDNYWKIYKENTCYINQGQHCYNGGGEYTVLDELYTVLNWSDYSSYNNTTIKIKYFAHDIEKVKVTENGDWIDLRSAIDIKLEKGEFRLIPLGVGMKLPVGYEAHMVPRSSTYKNFGIIQSNHCGIIDNSYCGDNDEWKYPAIALRDTEILKGDRICQFRIVKKQPNITFEEVEHLENNDRGGFGSTGKR